MCGEIRFSHSKWGDPMKKTVSTLILVLATSAHAQMGYEFPGVTAQQNLPGIINETTVNNIMCGDKLLIKDHMARMGFIIRSLRELVNDIISGNNADEIRAIVMVDSQVLRTHLTAVLPKTPQKIKVINPEKVQENKVIYQRYLLKMIGLTIDIEDELLKKPLTPDQIKAQQLKIANLIIKIDETVTEAHNLFRY